LFGHALTVFFHLAPVAGISLPRHPLLRSLRFFEALTPRLQCLAGSLGAALRCCFVDLVDFFLVAILNYPFVSRLQRNPHV
jgi:hypothetical protein